MERNHLILIIIGIAALGFAVLKPKEWWESCYSTKEEAILDRMNCDILNKLDKIQSTVDSIKSTVDDIEIDLIFK